MLFFGVCFFLDFIKLSAGNGFLVSAMFYCYMLQNRQSHRHSLYRLWDVTCFVIRIACEQAVGGR